ncbi:uncharacterized protein LOC117113811 [Anneissia japonica]|uniref:uncharacterized protein LOC117113811 n=1 Tax=Anneissia japonica TaxID=1529436 RepID=UPI0014255FEA|nr:uncharacterized protein LOC117113811 [Anneissia japonica]
MGVWHNLLVIAGEDCIKVYILERKENEYNFRLRNMTIELTENLFLIHYSVSVWDRKVGFQLRSQKQVSIVIYDLDDLQPQVFRVSHEPPEKTYYTIFAHNIRIFGDCILFTIFEGKKKFNNKN